MVSSTTTSMFSVSTDGDYSSNLSSTVSSGNLSERNAILQGNIQSLPIIVLVIFGSMAVAALSRMIVRFITALSYTVLLLIFGLLLGIIAKNVPLFGNYIESFYNLDAKVIMYVLIPVLLFNSGYAMEAHTFFKNFWQIVTLAVCGLVIVVLLTSYFVYSVFSNYHWNFIICLLFGALISATDLAAVVALLKELGASKQLAILLEGESLIRTGLAIVFFGIIETFANGENPTAYYISIMLILKFVVGPLYGYVIGQLVLVWLVNVVNDNLTEITVTLAATYLTFFIGEGIFKSSGALAVIVLGLTLANNRSSVSPEVELFLHRFWEMLSYLATTIIFVLAGTVLGRTVAYNITPIDAMLNLALYVSVNVIRALTLLCLSPIVTRLGYGLSVKNGIVMVWGGLKGANSLALALIIYHESYLDSTNLIQQQILWHATGVVFLTLVLNAPTLKPLLYILGMSEVSVPKRIAMASAVRNLRDVVHTTTSLYKTDRFLADADWDIVEKFTVITDPYQTQEEEAELNQLTSFERTSTCPDCRIQVPNEPSSKEYKELYEEARLRLLKAEKISYWRQFEHGILARDGLRRLAELVDIATDLPPNLTDIQEIEKTWKVKSFYAIVKDRLIKWQTSKEIKNAIPIPTHKVLLYAYKICLSTAFEVTIYIIIFLNCTFIIWQLIEESRLCSEKMFAKYGHTFDYLNYIFCGLYTLEATLKLMAFKENYFKNAWEVFDLIVLVLTYVDLSLDLTIFSDVSHDCNTGKSSSSVFSPTLLRTAKSFRFIRLVRSFRLVKGLLPQIIDYLDLQINHKLRFGYDVGKGYIMAEEEVLHYLEHLIDNAKIATDYQSRISANRLEVIKGLGLLQKLHPGVAVSIKTQQAARRILNNVRDRIHEMRTEGILDDVEGYKLEHAIEFQVKRLITIPPSIKPPPAEKIIGNLSWVNGDKVLIDYIVHNAMLASMSDGEMLSAEADSKGGLYVIISGLVKIDKQVISIEAETSEIEEEKKHEAHKHIKRQTKAVVQAEGINGPTAGTPMGSKLSDYLTTGSVLGEIALLTGKPSNIIVTCETSVQMYHISYDAIQAALELFTEEPSLEYRLWKVCALRVASHLLHMQPRYFQWTKERMKIYLERSKVFIKKHPLPEGGKVYEYPSFYVDNSLVIDVVLIHGVLEDPTTDSVWEGPVYIPQKITQLTLIPGKTDKHVLVLTIREAENLLGEDQTQTDLLRASSLCLRHASQQRLSAGKRLSDTKSLPSRRKSKNSLETLDEHNTVQEVSIDVEGSNSTDLQLPTASDANDAFPTAADQVSDQVLVNIDAEAVMSGDSLRNIAAVNQPQLIEVEPESDESAPTANTPPEPAPTANTPPEPAPTANTPPPEITPDPKKEHRSKKAKKKTKHRPKSATSKTVEPQELSVEHGTPQATLSPAPLASESTQLLDDEIYPERDALGFDEGTVTASLPSIPSRSDALSFSSDADSQTSSSANDEQV